MSKTDTVTLFQPLYHIMLIITVTAFVAGRPHYYRGMYFIALISTLHTLNKFFVPFRICTGPVHRFNIVSVADIGVAAHKSVRLDICLKYNIKSELIAVIKELR